jgi:hypothetical protein
LKKQLTRTKEREAFAVEAVKFENHEESNVSSSSFEEHSSFDDDEDQGSPDLSPATVFGMVGKRTDSYEEISESEKRGLRDLDFPPIAEVEETQEL